MFSYGQLKESEMYDVDFDHQFIETEKYDAKPTYKKFLGYRPGVAVIGDLIVGIENSDGNTNVRFHQKDTLKRFFDRFEQNGLTINRFRADLFQVIPYSLYMAIFITPSSLFSNML